MGSKYTRCWSRKGCTHPQTILLPRALCVAGLLLTGGGVRAQQAPPVTVPPPAAIPPANAPTPAPVVPNPNAPTTKPLTLSDVISLALRLQPQLASAEALRQESEQRLRQANSRFYPGVTPQYSAVNQYNYSQVSRFTTTNSGVATTYQGTSTDTRSAELALTYRLYDSGSRELNARQSRQSLRAQQYSEQNTRQTVIGNVADAYFNALRTAALVAVSEAQLARVRQTEEVITAQVEVGVAARKDTLQARADRLNAEVSLLQARNNAAVAQAQLRNTIGLDSNGAGAEPLVLADVPPPSPDSPPTATLTGLALPATNNNDKTAPPTATAPLAPVTAPATAPTQAATDATAIRQYSNIAIQSRPDILQSRQNIEVNQTGVSLARVSSRLLVTSDVTAAARINGKTFDSQAGNTRQINLLFSYPLFDGGFSRAQVRAQEAATRASVAQLQSTQQQVSFDVQQAYLNLAQARQTLPATEAAQRAAIENFNAARASKEEGVGSLVDVITAQTALVQAQTNYVQAIYNFYTADAALARAVGQADRISQVGASATAPAGSATIPATSTAPLATPAAPK